MLKGCMRTLLFGLTAVLFSGCAVLHENSRRITKSLDDNCAPSSTVARVALAPVAIPVGVATLAVDGIIVNPIAQIRGALDNASFVFTDIDNTGPFEIIVFPMRVVTFPVVFVVSEALRCTLPIDW